MPNIMSSRQRMLAALDFQEPDHTPCSFMLFNALRDRSETYASFIERQMAMGLDAYVQIPPRPPVLVNDYYNLHGLPVNYDPRVTIQEWVEDQPGESVPIMVKEYHTPGGVLRTQVRQTEDWPWGDHVPFLDDYLVPRSKKFLATEQEDLEALRYLLVPPTEAEIASFLAESQPALELARRHDLLLAGGWGAGADLIGWIHGLQAMVFSIYDQPEFMHEMLDIIATWNRRRMEVVLEAGIDLYIKRAWYENGDFWTPTTYREFLYPIVKLDAELAHQYETRLGYIITSNCMPLLDMFAEAGVDVLIGVDPGTWDLAVAKDRLAGRVALWGGMNGHLTVEHGADEEVRAEVRQALQVLSPGGGFILSPVDNVRENTPRAHQNVRALIEEWRWLTDHQRRATKSSSPKDKA
jgi:uroporphyrinogen-III decarboxylase